MKTRVSSKGQIILPAEIRQQDDIAPGQEFEVTRVEPGRYQLVRLEEPPNQGLVELLMACPVKGWFRPMSRRESTADIGLSRRG
jgi:AbrB family looped-hinge helix DNA binding protein